MKEKSLLTLPKKPHSLLINQLLFPFMELDNTWCEGLYVRSDKTAKARELLFGSFWCSSADGHLLLGNMAKTSNSVGFNALTIAPVHTDWDESKKYDRRSSICALLGALASDEDRLAYRRLERQLTNVDILFPERINQTHSYIWTKHDTEAGELVHLQIYHRAFEIPFAKVMYLANPSADSLWQGFKKLSPYPLLDGWKKWLLRQGFRAGWIRRLQGINLLRGYEITLNDERQQQLKDYLEAKIPSSDWRKSAS